MEAADNILRELDDVDLFPVRKALASDLAALKLAAQVDREGLYLRLAALSEQVMQLELLVPEQVLPSVNDDKPEPQAPLLPATESTGELLESLFARLRQSLSAALQQVGDYVRVRQRSEPVEPLLSPDESLYLSQNLRMMLERAQLAMLREEPEVYRHSLEQARRWLRTYYRLNAKTPQLQQALAELQQVPVAQELPDISGLPGTAKGLYRAPAQTRRQPGQNRASEHRASQHWTGPDRPGEVIVRKALLWFALALLAGAGLLELIEKDAGYVLIVFGNTSVEMSAWTAMVLVAVALFSLWLVRRLLHGSYSSTRSAVQRVVGRKLPPCAARHGSRADRLYGGQLEASPPAVAKSGGQGRNAADQLSGGCPQRL